MSLKTGSVLVVEDDRDVNALVGAYVELCGFEYRSALTGNRALEEARTRQPVLMILDLMLPDVDGIEICKRLKREANTRDIPIVLLTAMSSEDFRNLGQACGAAAYLTKPFDPDHLIETIERCAKGDEKLDA